MSKAMLIHTLSKSNCEFSKRKISQLLDETMKLIRKEVKKNKKFYYPTFGTFSLRSRSLRIDPPTNHSFIRPHISARLLRYFASSALAPIDIYTVESKLAQSIYHAATNTSAIDKNCIGFKLHYSFGNPCGKLHSV